MKKNMGSADRVIRLIVAAALIALYYFGVISGTIAIVALVAAVIFVVTPIVSFCPLYAIFGIRTCPASS